MGIIFVIIGTLVGAGFASGKEIFSFFFIYGKSGILGIFISSFIISWIVFKVFKICNQYSIRTCQDLYEYMQKRKWHERFSTVIEFSNISNLLCNMVNIFLIMTFFIMISGFSSFLNQEFGMNKIIGSLLIIILCDCVFLHNMDGLIKISNYVIPVLIVFIVCISIKNMNIVDNYNDIFQFRNSLYNNQNSINVLYAVIKAVLYACYNCVILIPVLIPLHKLSNSGKNNMIIAASSFVVISLLSFSIYNLLLQGNSEIFSLEMPVIGVVKNFGKVYKIAYTLIIGISIFTSAASSGLRLFKQL